MGCEAPTFWNACTVRTTALHNPPYYVDRSKNLDVILSEAKDLLKDCLSLTRLRIYFPVSHLHRRFHHGSFFLAGASGCGACFAGLSGSVGCGFSILCAAK